MNERDSDDAVREVMRTLARNGLEFYWYTRPADAPDNLVSRTGAVEGQSIGAGEPVWSDELLTLRKEWAPRIANYIERAVRDEYGDQIPEGFVRIHP